MSDIPRFDTIRVEVDGDTAVVYLNRPERLNAVAEQVLKDFVALADWLREQPDLHFLILDHEGPVFSAGAHLGEFHEKLTGDSAALGPWLRSNQRWALDMMAKMSEIDQISFAAMRGSAYGAGMAIAMTCDFRVMADDAVVNLPETNLGFFLTYGCTPRLVKTVGLGAAKQMIMFAEDWTAEQCQAAGAVEYVTGKDDVRPTIDRLIGTLRQRDWDALRVTKHAANAAAAVHAGDVGIAEPELTAGILLAGNVPERIEAFRAGRKK